MHPLTNMASAGLQSLEGPVLGLAARGAGWVWVKIKPPDHRFWSMFPLARVPFRVPILDPQPDPSDPSDPSDPVRCVPELGVSSGFGVIFR